MEKPAHFCMEINRRVFPDVVPKKKKMPPSGGIFFDISDGDLICAQWTDWPPIQNL